MLRQICSELGFPCRSVKRFYGNSGAVIQVDRTEKVWVEGKCELEIVCCKLREVSCSN